MKQWTFINPNKGKIRKQKKINRNCHRSYMYNQFWVLETWITLKRMYDHMFFCTECNVQNKSGLSCYINLTNWCVIIPLLLRRSPSISDIVAMVSHHLPIVSMFIYHKKHLNVGKSTNSYGSGHKAKPRCCVRKRANRGIKQHKAKTSDFRNRSVADFGGPTGAQQKVAWCLFFDGKETWQPLLKVKLLVGYI